MSYINKITNKEDKENYIKYCNEILELDAQITKIKKKQTELLLKMNEIEKKYK